MWCSCTGGKDSKGYTRQDEGDLWVHRGCGQPSKMVFEKMTGMRAPRGAKAVLSAHHHTNGTTTMRFATDTGKVAVLYYNPYPAKVDMNTPRDLLNEMWADLDASIVGIKTARIASEQEWHKIRARAQCEFIARIMAPFYENADAVGREALKRFEARHLDGNRPHETPGLAEDIWDPSTRFDGTPYSEENEKRVRSGGRSTSKPAATGNSIPESAVETVRQGITLGMFTREQMASTYNMTVDELVAQLGLD